MSASALIASKFKTCSAFQRVCVRIGIFFRENKINMLTWCDRRSGASVTISQHSQITHASVVKCKGCNVCSFKIILSRLNASPTVWQVHFKNSCPKRCKQSFFRYFIKFYIYSLLVQKHLQIVSYSYRYFWPKLNILVHLNTLQQYCNLCIILNGAIAHYERTILHYYFYNVSSIKILLSVTSVNIGISKHVCLV